MIILFWVVLILFSIVQSKIVHYSSLCYFPLTFLAALTANQLIERKVFMNRWLYVGLGAVGGLYILAVLVLPYVGNHIDLIRPLFEGDEFARENLNAQVNWTGWEVIPGILLAAVLVLSLRWISRQQFVKGFSLLYGGVAVFVLLTLIFFIGRIERYSQGAAIDFFESVEGKNCYVMTYGYKSYAQLFYFRKPPPEELDLVGRVPADAQQLEVTGFRSLDQFLAPPKPYFEPIRSYDKQWLLNGVIDKDVYVVAKVNRIDRLRQEAPGLKEIRRKNGFVFLLRKKSAD